VHRRFLRARRFNVQDALKQFEDTEEWRKANSLDQLYETIDLEHYEETRRLVNPLSIYKFSSNSNSTHNGQAAATAVVSPFTSLR